MSATGSSQVGKQGKQKGDLPEAMTFADVSMSCHIIRFIGENRPGKR
jgi:hypothetical protein